MEHFHVDGNFSRREFSCVDGNFPSSKISFSIFFLDFRGHVVHLYNHKFVHVWVFHNRYEDSVRCFRVCEARAKYRKSLLPPGVLFRYYFITFQTWNFPFPENFPSSRKSHDGRRIAYDVALIELSWNSDLRPKLWSLKLVLISMHH